MNRTSLCIKMLMLLKAKGKMNTQELAEALETNPRNIREYKKELIVAGYNIKETKGRYGGYELDEDCLFPALRLETEEIHALQESRSLLMGHREFDKFVEYNNAVDKILQMTRDWQKSHKYYMEQPGKNLSLREKEMLDIMQRACETTNCVKLTYQGAKDDRANEFLFDPYEIIHYHQAYYAVGYSHRRNDIRIFRFSEERMFNVEVQTRKFLKDSDYKLEKYIGKNSIIKGEFTRISVKVNKDKRRMFKETYWGMSFQEEMANDSYSIFSFISEDLREVYRNLFSFGNSIEILEPKSCKEAYVQQLKATLKTYQES